MRALWVKQPCSASYPGNNLDACGEAGAVTTNDAELAQKIRRIRNPGQAKSYFHDIEGYNGRLDSIHAGILRAKSCADWRNRMQVGSGPPRRIANCGAGSTAWCCRMSPSGRSLCTNCSWSVEERDEVQRRLGDASIGTGIHYCSTALTESILGGRVQGRTTRGLARATAICIWSSRPEARFRASLNSFLDLSFFFWRGRCWQGTDRFAGRDGSNHPEGSNPFPLRQILGVDPFPATDRSL